MTYRKASALTKKLQRTAVKLRDLQWAFSTQPLDEMMTEENITRLVTQSARLYDKALMLQYEYISHASPRVIMKIGSSTENARSVVYNESVTEDLMASRAYLRAGHTHAAAAMALYSVSHQINSLAAFQSALALVRR